MASWTLSSLPPPKSATLTAPSQCPEPLIIAIIAIIVITVTMVMVMHYDGPLFGSEISSNLLEMSEVQIFQTMCSQLLS